jgi:ubiquinone/menaquinone biosynthesis C-methylase UbiE
MSDDAEARKAQTRMRFNATAADYDAGPGVFAYFGRRLADVAGIAAGHRVLDVASGRGAVLFPAAERTGAAGEAIGVDLADEMARATNDQAARGGLRAQVRVMDAEQLDFPDQSFDRVLCGFGVMFFPDQQRALGEFRRVLKSGGRVTVSAWRGHDHQTSEVAAALRHCGITPPVLPGWINTSEQLDALLTEAGFTAVTVIADTHSFRYADAEEYWQQARGTGMRRVLDALDSAQCERVRAALADRMRPYQGPEGFHLPSTALLAVAVK